MNAKLLNAKSRRADIPVCRNYMRQYRLEKVSQKGNSMRRIITHSEILIATILFSIVGCKKETVDLPTNPTPVIIVNKDEQTYKSRLSDFLDYIDGTTKLLDLRKLDTLPERSDKLTELFAAVPKPVKGCEWTKRASLDAEWLLRHYDNHMLRLRLCLEILSSTEDGPQLQNFFYTQERAIRDMNQVCDKISMELQNQVQNCAIK